MATCLRAEFAVDGRRRGSDSQNLDEWDQADEETRHGSAGWTAGIYVSSAPEVLRPQPSFDISRNAFAHRYDHRTQQQYRGHHGDEPQLSVQAEHRQAHQQNRAEEEHEIGY